MNSIFDYKQSRKRILEILDDKTDIRPEYRIPKDESTFTYDNGIKTWVGALFLDMRNSSAFFTENKPDVVARIMRAYYSEIIKILEDNDIYREIGIRGDCIYAIYSVPQKSDLNDIFDDAVTINTFNNMFQKILSQKNYPRFSIGIGIGASEDVVVKVGRKNSGFNDKIWIGNAVVDASNLSSIADSVYDYPIYVNSTFYFNIKDFPIYDGAKETNSSFFSEDDKNNKTVYKCSVIKTAFTNWINRDFKDE